MSSESAKSPVDQVLVDWPEIASRIRNGDEGSFYVFYEHFFDFCFNSTRRFTCQDESTTLDIVQEVMLKVMSSIPVTLNHDQLRAWLFTVCKNKSLDWIAERKREREKLLRYCENQRPDGVIKNDSQSQSAQNEDRLQWIESQLSSIPKESQMMLQLRFKDGWTLRQIAEKFNLKVGAVDGKIRRILQKFHRFVTAKEVK